MMMTTVWVADINGRPVAAYGGPNVDFWMARGYFQDDDSAHSSMSGASRRRIDHGTAGDGGRAPPLRIALESRASRRG
jgi:hypothetical protein